MKQPWFRPVFVCPDCALASFEADHIRNDYCARCHKFFNEGSQPERILDTPNPNVPKGKDTTVK